MSLNNADNLFTAGSCHCRPSDLPLRTSDLARVAKDFHHKRPSPF